MAGDRIVREGTLLKGPQSQAQSTIGGMVAKRFVIERLAGRGGMASVFRALDTHTGRTVALKLMSAPAGDSPELERFTRESRLLAEFQHPGIVGHVAHGFTEQGEPFLVMEWLDGVDLCEFLRRGSLRIPDTFLLVRRLAEALQVAHRHHVIHRDLKPSSSASVERQVLKS